MSLGGVISHIFILFMIIMIFANKGEIVKKFFGKYGVHFSFLISLAALLGSLYYSEIVGFEPCLLCWYQRIFAYPIVFILALAIHRKDLYAIPYSILLAVFGGIIALYHTFIQISPPAEAFCGINSTTSCTELYFLKFGYITIPALSLTVFALVILLLFLSNKYKEEVFK